MLDQLLEADLDVLEGTGDSDVAHHVRDCARCQAIARQIVGDTRSLAVAVADTRTVTTILPITAAPSVARRRSHSRLAIVAGVAAALGGTIAVEPPTGVRANIIRTPNPSVTVVWLYQ
jgi:hypothetical protein